MVGFAEARIIQRNTRPKARQGQNNHSSTGEIYDTETRTINVQMRRQYRLTLGHFDKNGRLFRCET